MKLFAVFLGGRAEKCNIELHDVVFTCADQITDCYDDLLDKWFGDTKRLHIDSWLELKYIDGYEILLSKSKFPTVDASTDNILIGFQSSVIFLFFDKNCLNKLNK